MGALRVCVSASAADRLSCARDLIRSCAPGTRVLIVGASRGAADDLAREVAASVPATFGLQRLSLTQLAAKTAILSLASEGVTSSTWLGTEAVAARVAFDARRQQSLDLFRTGLEYARLPARARANAAGAAAGRRRGATAHRTAARRSRSRRSPRPRRVVVRRGVERGSGGALSRRRARGGAATQTPVADVVVFLDLAYEHAAERELVSAVVAGVRSSLATVPSWGSRQPLVPRAAWWSRRGARLRWQRRPRVSSPFPVQRVTPCRSSARSTVR